MSIFVKRDDDKVVGYGNSIKFEDLSSELFANLRILNVLLAGKLVLCEQGSVLFNRGRDSNESGCCNFLKNLQKYRSDFVIYIYIFSPLLHSG